MSGLAVLVIILKITLEFSINLQDIRKRVVGRVMMDISPSNIFLTLTLPVANFANTK